MTISHRTKAAYHPWGNAELTFTVPNGATSPDPTTGNLTQDTISLSYLAHLSIEAPNSEPRAGVDNSTYVVRGRLLSPNRLDTRITNNSQAQALINGYSGRFELNLPLDMDRFAYRDLNQQIQGTFRIIGGSNG